MIRLCGVLIGILTIGAVALIYYFPNFEMHSIDMPLLVKKINSMNSNDVPEVQNTLKDKDTAGHDAVEPKISSQIFWGPFNTRISAQGFSKQIKKRTGLNINVIKKESFKYMVAFEYTTDEERLKFFQLIKEKARLHLNNRDDI
jgi:hypothetical protein